MADEPHDRRAAGLTAFLRAVGEARRGGGVALHDGDTAALLLAAESVTATSLAWLRASAGGQGLHLVLTAARARRLGRESGSGAVAAIALSPQAAPGAIRDLADPTGAARETDALAPAPAAALPPVLAEGAIELMKAAGLLPAALLAVLPRAAALARIEPAFVLAAEALGALRREAAADLRHAGSARVPLEGAEAAEIHAFRPADGGREHLAIVIGALDAKAPVLTRLHSECLTGDLLGSLRCDCGQQLRGAIAAIAAAGGGVLLYLAQEGRGIGLVNKLRAYRLQDAGADTLEANLELGFGADERLYAPAAAMLRWLGIGRVRLLTNNPAKVEGLAQNGIEVSERVPLIIAPGGHNRRYLQAKAARLGHMF